MRRECTAKGLEVSTYENGIDMKGLPWKETTSADFNQTNCRCNNINPSAEQVSFLFHFSRCPLCTAKIPHHHWKQPWGKNRKPARIFLRVANSSLECLREMLAEKLSV